MDPIICKTVKGYSDETFCYNKASRNFKRKFDDKQFRYKTISSLGCEYSCQNVVFFLYCIPSSSYSEGGFVFLPILKNYQSYSDSRAIYWKGGQGFIAYTYF